MQQTVLNTTRIRGVFFLYYFAYGTAVVSGVFCVLFLYLLLSNYYAPYSPEKLDAMIRKQQEMEQKLAEQNTEQNTEVTQAETEAVSENESSAAAATGQQPNIDPEQLKVQVFEEPKGAFQMLPSDYKEMIDLRHRLAQDSSNLEIRERIRLLDQQLRIEYFRRREIADNGAPFLLFAACVLICSARIASVLNRKLPQPEPKNVAEQRKNELHFTQFGLFTVFLLAAICLGIACGMMFSEKSDLEKFLLSKLQEDAAREQDRQPTQTAQIAQPSPSPGETETVTPPVDFTAFFEKYERNWPSFRGHDGSGVTRHTNIPVKWNAETGENILWKSEIPLGGHNSPILWEERVFLTGADENERKIYCYSTKDGALLWDFTVPEIPTTSKQKLEMNVNLFEDTGYAAPTAVTDGERVYAIFANLDLVAVDFSGKMIWGKNLGIPDNHYGYAASLAFYKDRVIVQYDQGEGKKENESKLIAYRGTDGEILWETPRTMMNSWPSPVVRKIGDSWQLLTGVDPWLVSYDPENGKELWRCKAYSGGDTAASPTGFGHFVYAANSMPGITLVDASGSGDLSKTEKQLWQNTMVRPDACSPIATESYVYSLGAGPYLQALDVKTGEMIWEMEVGDYSSFYSSPAMAEGKLYLFDKAEDGQANAFVIDPSKAVLTEDGSELDPEKSKDMLLATNPMIEPIFASPAFSEGRIYIRSEKTLYCIEAAAE